MIYCTKCGYANEDGTNFCVQCGYNFQNGQSANTIAPKKESSVLKAILCALALVATIFVSMFSAILFIGGTFDGIPSMAVCGFVFLAGSVVGAVFSIKGLSKYSVKKTPIKQMNNTFNKPYNTNFKNAVVTAESKSNASTIVNNNSVKYVLKGANGQLYVYENKIEITRKGVWAFANQGLKGTKTIPISQIKSIQLKKAGVVQGYIQFGVSGGIEGRGGYQEANYDENTVTFISTSCNQIANNIKAYIESIIVNRTSSQNTIIQQTSSSADELKKFKELLDAGAITQEEFDTKKKQLLGL